MSAPERCEVCGELLDEWGCLGEFRGKHVPIEMAKLRGELELLRQRADAVVREWEAELRSRSALGQDDLYTVALARHVRDMREVLDG